MNSAAKEYSIFLSYARQDEAWVADFVKALNEAGIQNYWFNQEAIASQNANSMSDLWIEVQNALRDSDTLIVFLSPNSIENSNVLFELGAAFGSKKRIIPVLIGDVDQHRIPLSLTNRTWLRADSPLEAGKRAAEIIKRSA